MMHDKKNPILDTLLKILDDAKAIDVTVIDVRNQTTITDYMVICSARSSRHVKAIGSQLMELMKAAGFMPMNHNGLEGGEWGLIDFGDAIVHVMQPETRAFYNLDELWQEKAP
jgi:ribosome-associated protein